MKYTIISMQEDYGRELNNPSEAGKLYAILAKGIANCQTIILDFDGVYTISRSFIEISLGELYIHYKWKQIKKYIKLRGLRNDLNSYINQTIAARKFTIKVYKGHRY